MSTQITVRLEDDVVQFVDKLVAEGREKSRASVVSRALRRERQREAAERDARILAQLPRNDEFDALAEFAAGQPMDLD